MSKKEKNVPKPLGLVRKELQETIINAINTSGLPLSMSAYIVKDIAEQVSAAAAQQESAEIAEYEAQLNSSDVEE